MLSNLRVIAVVSVCLLLPAFGCSSTAIAQSWYNADIHLHANGCSNNNRSAAEILGLMKQEGINVGSILVWGGGRSLELDPVHFRGQEDDPVSETNYIAHWDIEISQLPGSWHGHMDLLNVAQKDAVVPNQVNYPGQDYLLPNYQYVQSQGGIVGYGHGSNWQQFSYSVPTGCCPPRELPLDVALARVDFLASEQINEGLYWLWYSMLNAGFHFPLLGTSDLGCVWPRVGTYHAAFPLPTGDTLTYTKFIEAVREGRTVIRRNESPAPDYLDIRVNGVGVGGELILPNQATTVNVQVDASSVAFVNQRVELLLDGNVIESQVLTNSLQTYQWSVPLNKSSWIAAKTTGAHTAATFVLLGGCPIRNDPLSARNWKGYLDAYYQVGVSGGEFGTSAVEVRQKVDEAKLVWEQIAQEGEGSIAMDCNAGTVLVANFMNANTDFLKSRVYLWNPSQSAGNVSVRVFTVPLIGGTAQELTTTALSLGSLGAKSALNIKLEDILTPLGITTPYTTDGGNLTLEFTTGPANVRGVAQVFSDTLAFGTYPLQEILSTSTGSTTVLVANFTNGNNAFLNSRVYLWNPSQSAGSVTVRAYTLPSSGPSILVGTVELGLLDGRSSLNIKIAEDVLPALGIPLPYTDDGGNLAIEVTVGAENVRGVAQVFSSELAFGTYPMQVIQ